MARKIIDLRTSDQKEGITSLQRTSELFAGILKTIGKGQQIKQNRRTLDRVTRAILAGATTPEAILAASQPTDPQFSPGGRGILQRIGGVFQPQGGGVGENIQSTILASLLKRSLNPPLLSREEQRDKALFGLKDRPGKAGGAKPSKSQAQRDKDMRTITSEKATEGQKNEARERLKRNKSLFAVKPGTLDTQFEKAVKDTKLKKKVPGATFDKAFGKEAFEKGLKAAIDQGLTEGAAPESIERAFIEWWDRKAAEEDPSFEFGIEFIPRSEFQDLDEATARQILQDLDEATARQILQEAGGDKDRARQIAKERGFNL